MQGIALILSGPSGVGKSSICKELFARIADLRFSVSCATRSPRAGEINDVSYHFIDKATFEEHIRQDDFLEYAEVHGNYYGTLKQEVLPVIEQGGAIILDIDVQGARKIRRCIAGTPLAPLFVSIFIAPPSVNELERRLRGRNTETEEAVVKRLDNAKMELAASGEYDYVVVNDTLQRAVDELERIIMSVRGKA